MTDTCGKPISDRRAWCSAELARNSDWVTELSPNQIDSLNALAETLPQDSADWLEGDARDRFSEPAAELIEQASAELGSGRGFVLFRGLDASDPERLRRVFWSIGTALGQPVMQNARGEVLSIVSDRFGGAERGVDTRGYESNDELRFHCDGGDCIGMSCVRQAAEGGENGLVSLFSIYNEVLASFPEHLDALLNGYPLYARKERGDAQSTKNLGKVNAARLPVFAWEGARMSAWLNIQLAELAAEVSGQAFSEEERAALTCVEEIANRPEMQLTFLQQPGDVLFINNLAVMHRRQRYIDAEGDEAKRMLYRMWINLHESQGLVATHAVLRQGIRGPKPVIVAA
ncbi:MAG: TauD/TfdA family dioxygenase [Pseudomonadaceae bacterium]|nr:TauD/TfdA family dioxygenase [Pseudomonadaceae bacterium]